MSLYVIGLVVPRLGSKCKQRKEKSQQSANLPPRHTTRTSEFNCSSNRPCMHSACLLVVYSCSSLQDGLFLLLFLSCVSSCSLNLFGLLQSAAQIMAPSGVAHTLAGIQLSSFTCTLRICGEAWATLPSYAPKPCSPRHLWQCCSALAFSIRPSSVLPSATFGHRQLGAAAGGLHPTRPSAGPPLLSGHLLVSPTDTFSPVALVSTVACSETVTGHCHM